MALTSPYARAIRGRTIKPMPQAISSQLTTRLNTAVESFLNTPAPTAAASKALGNAKRREWSCPEKSKPRCIEASVAICIVRTYGWQMPRWQDLFNPRRVRQIMIGALGNPNEAVAVGWLR